MVCGLEIGKAHGQEGFGHTVVIRGFHPGGGGSG